MSAKHTPGPWSVSLRPTAADGIEHSEGFVAFVANPRQPSEERLAGESWLDMRNRTQPDRLSIEREKQANARLIAAAPDLLEALKAMEAMYTHAWDRTDGGLLMMPGSVERFDGACEKARVAIAKATGEQP